jgi:zinc D-Ala-D-Ala dipeptidase
VIARAALITSALMCCAPANAGELPPGFVALSATGADVVEDIRYAGPNNFTGRTVPGYERPICWLRRETAEALARVAAHFGAAEQGRYRLIIYDCYRPQRAVDAFVAWAKDEADAETKAAYYPSIRKPDLLGTYIGTRSGHSKGVAVDVGLIDRASGAALDFGTPFDFFGPESAMAARISRSARANRRRLKSAMEQVGGFRNYPGEWWHYSLDLPGAKAFDIPIR